jgi:dTMP kinase
VLEGAEGVGKTTQVRRLADRLEAQGVACRSFREPGGTPLGDEIRALLLAPGAEVGSRAEALLFMAARAQLLERVEALLAEGVTVVLDRFFLSTYAYQIVGRGLPPELVRAANELATGRLVPDLTLLLSCDPDVARRRMLARGGLDRMELEEAGFHERVAAAFLAAADPAWQRRHPEVGPVVRVDADGTPDAVAGRVMGVLAERWPETFRVPRESDMVGAADPRSATPGTGPAPHDATGSAAPPVA